jgi:hypothetical protein
MESSQESKDGRKREGEERRGEERRGRGRWEEEEKEGGKMKSHISFDVKHV